MDVFICTKLPRIIGDPAADYRTDCFLMSFTPQHYRAWSTYYGGDDYGPPYESIFTLAVDQNYLYAGGFTSKNFVPQDSYFPLHDPGNGAWFEPNFSAIWDTNADGFLAAFCTDLFTSVGEYAHVPTTVLMPYSLGGDLWSFSGLEQGLYNYRVVDMLGRTIISDRIFVADVLSPPIHVSSLAVGVYPVVFEKEGKRWSTRIMIQR